MLCDKCKQREANVHITQSINGVTTERNLCSECAAKEEGFMNVFSTDSFFQDLFETSLLKRGSRRNGWLMPSMASMNLLGSQPRDRYSMEFGDVGAPLIDDIELPKITVPTGDSNVSDTKEKKEKTETDDLKSKLEEAIRTENFEEAARLRDLIKNEKDKPEK